METANAILVSNCLATSYMVGLIWMVQVVHYPLFAFIGQQGYQEYQKRHQMLTTFVVGPPMLVEAFTSILLAWYPPTGVSYWQIFTGIALMFVIWLSTAAIQVPCHGKLALGFDKRIHRRLVASNWIRTLAWSARGVLVGWMLLIVLSAN